MFDNKQYLYHLKDLDPVDVDQSLSIFVWENKELSLTRASNNPLFDLNIVNFINYNKGHLSNIET